MKTELTYKGYKIETVNGSSFIYDGEELQGCTHTDFKSNNLSLNNSSLKAKRRIDLFKEGKTNTLKFTGNDNL